MQGNNEIHSNVYKTNNYDQFKFMEGNRNVDLKHLHKLTESFKVKQLPIPIIVNKDFEILEGQHRYLVCKNQQLPLYYIVIEDCSINDAILINTISKKWGMNDYLEHFAALGYEHYINLKNFMEITSTNCNMARIFCDEASTKISKQNNKFATGNFEMIPMDEALQKFDLYKDFNKCPAFKMQIFIMAVMKVVEHPKYNHKRMVSKIDDFYYKVTKRVSKNEYIQLLTEIYNYNTNKENKVYFYIDNE